MDIHTQRLLNPYTEKLEEQITEFLKWQSLIEENTQILHYDPTVLRETRVVSIVAPQLTEQYIAT